MVSKILHMRFSRIRERLFGGAAGGVFRGMATLAVGTGMARIIGIAAIPLLTRIYSPTDYGVLAIYVSLITIVAPILTLRYVLAVPLPRSDAMAMSLMALSGASILVIGSFLTLFLWIFGPTVLSWISMERLIPWWWLLALGAMATASYEALSMWATRKRAFLIIAKTQVTQSLLGEGIKLIFGLLAFKPLGLILGQIIGQSAGASSFLYRFREDYIKNCNKISKNSLLFIAAYYRGFPIYRLPSVILLALSTQAPLMLTSAFFGAETTGQLGLALMALALPASLLADNIGKAYLAEISRLGKKQPEAVRRVTNATIRRSLAIAVIPAAILLIAGKPIFTFSFGPKWESAGLFASILSVYILAQFMQRATTAHLMSLYDGQRELLWLNIQRLCLTYLVFWIGNRIELPLTQILGIYSVLISVHYVFSMFIASRKIPHT